MTDYDAIWEAACRGEFLPPEWMDDCEPPEPEEELPKEPTELQFVETAQETKSVTPAVKAEINERARLKGSLSGISTGFKELDNLFDGFRSGRVYTIGARPGVGKSELGLTFALNVAKQGKQVDFYTLEMKSEEHVLRATMNLAHVSTDRMREGKLEADDWTRITSATKELDSMPIWWDERSDVNIDQLRDRIKQRVVSTKKSGNPLAVVVIDHVLLINGTNPREPRRNQMCFITKSLKALAKSCGISVVMLAQFNRSSDKRDVKDKRPILSDLKESGSIEEDSDVVMLLFREDYYNRDSAPNHELMVFVEKARSGRTGTVGLYFDDERHRITQERPEWMSRPHYDDGEVI